MEPHEVIDAFAELVKTTPKVKSLAEFDAAVREHSEGWRKKDGMAPKFWFRGHADSAWQLTPPALRVNNYDDPPHDQHFFVDFKRRGFGLVNPAPPTAWSWLYVAQHHGFPTRLLDWSEASQVALFFAVGHNLPDDDLRKADACVWVLNPAALNVKMWNFHYVVTMVDGIPESDALLMPYLKGDPIPTGTPPLVSVIPEYVSPRVRAQRGAFVAFADDGLALARIAVEEAGSKTPICKPIVLGKDALDAIEAQLIDAGAGQSAFFPDVTGLCEELARRRHLKKY